MTTGKEPSTRREQDWIESFLDYTEGVPAPRIFRLWCGITAVAATLERRVYVHSAGEKLFPNLFVLLVAPPGVGKTQAIKRVADLWKQIPDLHIAPDNVTKASFVDSLVQAKRTIVRSPTELLEFHSMQVAADELGVLMSAHDLDFLSVLNKLYDNPSQYDERRRTIKEPIIALEPQISVLAGTQPGFMASIFPEEAWGMGFTSRLIMLYSATKQKVKLFGDNKASPTKRKNLIHDLNCMMQLFGGFKWTPDAATAIEIWNDSVSDKTAPGHSKLEHYNQRRIMHLMKLCMVSAASRGNELLITMADFERALAWLMEAEETMPDVFRNMTQKSDTQTLQELHFFCWSLYSKGNKQPIHEQKLVNFLSTKVPTDRIEKILDIADRAGIVKRQAGTTLWVPATKNAMGLE